MLSAMHIALACLAGLLAVVNLIQVFIGRQLVKPSASKRSATQIRRQSAGAASLMFVVALLFLAIS
jgi:hypothetical protein